jgi:uncharacterized membrane protein YhaH (DUF805 family)
MALVLAIKPKGRNRYGKIPAPCNPIQSVKSCLSQYASFAGRSSRSEFWWMFLAVVVIGVALSALNNLLNSIFNLAIFLPVLGVTMRRLHDINRSGWWVLLNLTLFPVTLYVLLAWPGSKDDEAVAQVFE